MKIKMVTQKTHNYGGRKHVFGDPFDVSREHLRLVKAMGWGVEVPHDVPPVKAVAPKAPPAQPAKAAPKMQTRALALGPGERVPELPEDQPPEPTWVGAGDAGAAAPRADADETHPSRKYKRRDLTAEP